MRDMTTKEKIDVLIQSVIDNTSLDYVSGYNSGISDRYECSQCGGDVRCRDYDKATLNDIDHSSDCAYVLANQLYSEVE